ncbi:putative CBF/NF-Y family transcription factor [Aspergillus stella-maris]|uniref:putative CBF/NF-Y family transcription factor n=1 Tax=Aspergillus stella-maris TaxID=1810926 RepID=UPI003CCCC9BE
MSSSSPFADADAAAADTQSQQTQSKPLQATEQQLKARAEGVSIEDYLLPRSITLRLAKSVLPPNTSVQKDAVLAIQKAATVFVSYLSSAANESTLKRTVTPADVLNALSEIEFEGFRPRLERELDAFTESKAAKRRPKKGEAGHGDAAGGAETEKGEGQAGTEGGSGEKKEAVVRGVKRVKRDGNGADVEVEDEEDQDHDMEDEQEAEEVEEEHDEDATEEEEDEDEEVREDEDIDRVEGLDHLMDPDAGGDTDSDEEGPGSQLRGDLGLG